MSEEHGAPRAPTGTHDVMPPESARWEALLAAFASLAERWGFKMVHTPLFEDVRVFHRGIGATSEVVGKEMYEFTDRGGRQMALRPEGTASIVRAFVQHRPAVPWRAWYATPSFRYERPQAGRYRQHHQVGVEALGSDDADVDVEVIALARGFFAELGLERFTLKINSMGDPACRPAYIEALRTYLDEHRGALCDEHAERFAENPLRVLDCKKGPCLAATVEAPMLIDALCEGCRSHHDRVLAGLDACGVAYVADVRLVRGFDYYTRTTFEFASGALEGAQNAIGGGGRYDGLVELLGGPPTPGIGFGIGIERVLLACDAEGTFVIAPANPAAFVVDVTGGEAARDLVFELRRRGLFVERAYDGRSMKSQLKAADRSGAPIALLLGSEELAEKSVTIRALREAREQISRPVEELLAGIEQTGEITW
jgi:histidyl-tRNA synthetase